MLPAYHNVAHNSEIARFFKAEFKEDWLYHYESFLEEQKEKRFTSIKNFFGKVIHWLTLDPEREELEKRLSKVTSIYEVERLLRQYDARQHRVI